MKLLTINGNDLGVDLTPLAFAWCNAVNTKALAHNRKSANLEIVCPHENKVYEYHYFFDLRYTLDEEYRPEGITNKSALEFVWSELLSLGGRIRRIQYHLPDDSMTRQEFDEMDERLENLWNKIDKLADEALSLSEVIKDRKEEEE